MSEMLEMSEPDDIRQQQIQTAGLYHPLVYRCLSDQSRRGLTWTETLERLTLVLLEENRHINALLLEQVHNRE